MENKKNKIDGYKDSLYSRKYVDTSKEDLNKLKKLEKKKNNLQQNWDDVDLDLERHEELYKYEKKGINVFTLIFVLSFSFFIISAGIAGFFLYFQKNEIPLNRIDVKLTVQDKVDSGSPLEYKIKIENNTDLTFKNISLFIKYPYGSLDWEEKIPKEVEELELKDILPGGTETLRRKIIFSGAPDETKKVSFKLNYQLDGYSTILTKKKEFSVKIGAAPIFVKVKTSEYVISDKEFDISIEVSSNSSYPLKNILLIGRYPNGFEITKNDPNPIFKTDHKNIFRIDSLGVGEKKVINMKAKMVGENGEMKALSFIAGDSFPDNNEIKIKYFDSKEKIYIKKPGLDLKLFCNGVEIEDDVATSDQKINCEYTLSNNLPSKIADIKIRLAYDDSVLNEEKNNAEGGYIDTNNNYIFWDKNTIEKLTVLKSNEQIKIPVKFTLKTPLELAGNIKDPELPLIFTIKGINFDEGSQLGVVDRVIKKNIKLNSLITVDTDTSYETSPFENSGGPTPILGREATYTINWMISNSTNKIKNVKVVGKLPVGVEWKNIYSPEDSYVSYEPSTRTIKWSIKNIQPYIGYRTKPKKFSFQVGFTPVLNDLDNFKSLVEDIKITAVDEYTDSLLYYNGKDNTTRLEGEKDYEYGIGRVKQN